MSWDRFFRTVDRLLKWCQRHRVLPLRRKALAAAERWMLARFDQSDGLGAIYPPIVWSIVALKCLGYPDDSPEVQYCHAAVAGPGDWRTSRRGTARLQPCKSPVWDTAITVRALAASGVRPDNPAMREAIDWLLAQQISRRGDWAETVDAEPGGWCFEYANDFYPDSDDTAMVLMALQTQFSDAAAAHEALPPELRLAAVDRRTPDEARQRIASMQDTVSAIDRGLRWLLAMQNRDGGWGAFDRNNDREFLCHVPFADHNAMIDPSTPDLTGRVLEALGQLGPPPGRSGRRSGRGLCPPHPERRRQLVRPLGRQLYLRHLAVARRADGRRRADRRSGRSWPAPTGCWPISRRAAAGANRPTATSSRTFAAKARPPPRKRPGR